MVAFFTAGCGKNDLPGTTSGEETDTISVTGVSLNKTTTTIGKGSTETLTATIAPEDASNKNVSWSSSDTDVATVINEGLVTSVNEGTATITVTTEDGSITAQCTVTVVATFSDITYPVTVSSSGAATGETVSADFSESAEGATVTLTASLNSGRQVTLSASGVTFTPSTISSNGGKATFTMPAVEVTVTAVFSDISAGTPCSRTANTVNFNMHYVPSGGTFTMGEDVESTTQDVTLNRNFWMGETEVTQGLWEDVWGTTWPGDDPEGSDYGVGTDYPAYYVNWYEAVAFCNILTQADDSIADTEQVYYSDSGLTTAYTKANAASSFAVYVDWNKTGYRLPTEAEWEYAARYIDGTSWNGGDHVSGGPVCTDETDPDKIGDYAWYGGNNGAPDDPTYGAKEVGQKTANALGLRDMSGNVWEWCYDWYADYSGESVIDPTGPESGSDRVCHGGDWANSGELLSCAVRAGFGIGFDGPVFHHPFFGFRLCRTAY